MPLALIAGSLAASLGVVSLLGAQTMPGTAIGALALKLGAMWPAAAALTAAYGWGRPPARLWKQAEDAPALQFAAGLAIFFSLAEVLGIVGLLRPATALAIWAVGIALTVWDVVERARRGRAGGRQFRALAGVWALGAPAAAVLLVAAAMPPAWLWASEYGGYDALSYHLQLPQEWLAAGRIAPSEHNVYSYLPGYIEAVFAQIGAATMAPRDLGLLGGDGWRLIACQALHAGLALIAAWLTGCVTTRLAVRAGAPERMARWAGAAAGCIALATPWAVVTGSLAYNEAGVNAMLAGALLVSVQSGLSPAARGGLVGLLVGAACGFKPTSLFFAGLPAGVMLAAALWRDRRGSIRGPIVGLGVGAAVGLLTLAPWLVRNALHGGNPVFPFAADLFGSAHWTADQLARYRSAHTFVGSVADRFTTLVWASPGSSPGDAAVERFRGFANPQWGLFVPMVVGAALVTLAGWKAARRDAALLGAGLLAQVAAWLAFTHLQSRFLLPTLPVGAILVGLALARVRVLGDKRPDGRAGAGLLGGVLVLAQTGFLVVIYQGQHLAEDGSGGPGLLLGVFPDFFTGAGAEDREASAAGWCHSRSETADLVYLVGDGAPLYFGPGVVYHTTFDTSPLGTLMRESPNDPAAWEKGLRALGIGWLIVNPGEIARLQRSGWYDPSVTPESVRDFATTQGVAERLWRDEGRYLVRLGGGSAR